MTIEDPNPWVRVEFQGKEYWVEAQTLNGNTDGPIAYLEHVDNGELNPYDALFSESFAHIYGDIIKRYQNVIGTLSDLKVVE